MKNRFLIMSEREDFDAQKEYLRILEEQQKWLRKVCKYSFIVFAILFTVSAIFAFLTC